MEQLLSSIALLLLAPILVFLLLLQQQAPLFIGVAAAQTNNQLNPGSRLTPTTTHQNLIIRSSSGVFAFGFCRFDPSVHPDQFILAIWFDFNASDCTNKPVVWFARNSEPTGEGINGVIPKDVVIVEEQYVLSLPAENIPLSLLNDNQAVWIPPTKYSSNSSIVPRNPTLVLQDSGNLQLFDVTNGGVEVLWESFGDPTDTLLPGMNFTNSSSVYLQSRKSYTNFTSGRFILVVQSDSNVVAYLGAQESGSSHAYWATGTDYGGACVTTLFFNESALYYDFTGTCVYSNLTDHTVVQLTPNYTEGYYKYMALDPDGTVRVYVHQKNNMNGSLWDVVSLFPDNILSNGCTRIDLCGLNSYCSISNGTQYVSCFCPDSYKFLDGQDNYMGCTPKFIPHICDGKDHSGEFKTVEMQNTSWSTESVYKKHELAPNGSFQECVSSCLHSCLCVAVLIDDNNDKCMELWTLTAGMQSNEVTNVTMKALIKVRQSEPVVPMSLGTKLLCIAVSILATVSVAYTICNLWQSYVTKKKKAKMSMSGLRSFTYKEIKQATGGFKELLGRGGFGHVFKGELSYLEPPYVAVKKLIRSEFGERDFDNEVQSMGQIHHKNLARLIGYCKQGMHRMLVFQYMHGGTLADFIFDSERRRPCWSCIAEAAIGIATGLEYLHEGCKSQIIHCDIKPENILFDDIHTPKITDFGIARLLGDQQTQHTITSRGIAGTIPYAAPEWFDGGGKVNNKVDVYSFGVMLLEMICCKRAAAGGQQLPDDDSQDHSSITVSASALSLRDWAESLLRRGRADLLVEGESEALADMKSVERFTRVAIWCLQKEPSARPRMRKVVQMLEGTIQVDPLPDIPRHPSFSTIPPSGGGGGGGGSLSSSTTVGSPEID